MDFIWDDMTGEQLAWIENAEVFSAKTRRKIATVRDGQLYSLRGERLNWYLRDANVVGGDGNRTPGAFKKLCISD